MRLTGLLFAIAVSSVNATPSKGRALPAEWEPHRRTWMALPHRVDIWGGSLSSVQRAHARVAKAIAEFEPVTVLVPPSLRKAATALLGENIETIPFTYDDMWARDTGPVFGLSAERALTGLFLSFNGWGGKQDHRKDATLGKRLLAHLGVPIQEPGFVAEGGGLEWDGEGTLLTTESALLNRNRNPSLSREKLESRLRQHLGIERVLWLPGASGLDITDGHIDGYARFAAPGVVLVDIEPDETAPEYAVCQEHLRTLRAARDARGRALQVIPLERPRRKPGWPEDFAASYVNFYLVNGGVLLPKFGDAKADRRAHETFRRVFPTRKAVAVPIDAIADGGGGIHCITQQEPAARR